MYFGADYYPEHWKKGSIENDIKLMKKANINVVRLAEFAWSIIEKKEGEYDFQWLDDAIEALGKAGISVILGTPTAAPPKWLINKYPDILPVDYHNMTKGFGTRRHYCPNHDIYREYCKNIARKYAERYGKNEYVIAWQADNELSGICCCENCRKKFGEWLRRKYKTIDNMNQTWGTVFWSQTYESFEDVIVPTYSAADGFSQGGGSQSASTPYHHNPAMLLDYFRFNSDSYAEFQSVQIKEIRKYSDYPITHNYMASYSQLNYYDLGKELDFISWDCYPVNTWSTGEYQCTAMDHDFIYGVKNKNFWMMEQQSGPCGWRSVGSSPQPGQIKLWTYQALAHGADNMVYFRWHTCTFGTEQYWFGILDHDGIPRRRYNEIAAIGEEVKKPEIKALFASRKPKSEVAVVKSFDNDWSHEINFHNNYFFYYYQIQNYYRAFNNHNVGVDVISPEFDFEGYKIVMMPSFNLMNDELLEKCKRYVSGGGTLLVTYRSGTRDWNNNSTTLRAPGYFGELAGVELMEFDAPTGGRTVDISSDILDGLAYIWCDVLRCETAKPLAFYNQHYYKGSPAITVNSYGKGKVYYIGCDLKEEPLKQLGDYLIKNEGITRPPFKSETGVEIVTRTMDGNKVYVILNHTGEEKKVDLNREYKSLFTGYILRGEAVLEPFGVEILTI